MLCVLTANRRFRKRVVDVAPVIELVLSQVSVSASDTVWRVQVEALNIAVRCTIPVSANAVPSPFFSPQLAKYMLNTYFVRFPLWSRISLGHRLQMSNATAEVGVRILKHDEAGFPHKPGRTLRLDEYLAARIPKRVAHCRLLLTQVKQNWVRRRRDQDKVSAKETWSKSATLPLSPQQFALYLRLKSVVKWRRETKHAESTLPLLCAELSETVPRLDDAFISPSALSKIINGKSWPADKEVENVILLWVATQERRMNLFVAAAQLREFQCHFLRSCLTADCKPTTSGKRQRDSSSGAQRSGLNCNKLQHYTKFADNSVTPMENADSERGDVAGVYV